MKSDDKKEKDSKKESNNIFKGRFNKKPIIKGYDWFHDPSGEELEIIYEEE